MAAVMSARELAAGEVWQSHFFVAWHFPKLSFSTIPDKTRYYVNRFGDVAEVASFAGRNFEYLSGTARQWYDAWYDGSLPLWFLERTFVNTSTLATTTFHRMRSGRFYAWEGVGCCEGICTHVWHYAQAMARGAYAFKSLLDNGVMLTFGSDWPGTSVAAYHMHPKYLIYAAVTRKTLKGMPEGGWYPKQKISVAEALKAYTINGAFAAFEDHIRGSLESGKLADVTIFDRNVIKIAPEDILNAEVTHTIVGGRIVFEKK